MIDKLIEKIINTPLFLRLKNVEENGPYHDHELTYDHLIKTKNIAQRELKAEFITNSDAKKAFLEYINENFYGFKKADLIVIIALLHDVGKILSVKENGIIRSIVITASDGETIIPGHEYWGSTIVSEFLKDLSLPKEVIDYVSNVVGLHGEFQGEYLPSRRDWPMEKLLNDIKSKAQGLYIESLFNHYCDVHTAGPFKEVKPLVIKVFNQPELYIKREYVIT